MPLNRDENAEFLQPEISVGQMLAKETMMEFGFSGFFTKGIAKLKRWLKE